MGRLKEILASALFVGVCTIGCGGLGVFIGDTCEDIYYFEKRSFYMSSWEQEVPWRISEYETRHNIDRFSRSNAKMYSMAILGGAGAVFGFAMGIKRESEERKRRKVQGR